MTAIIWLLLGGGTIPLIWLWRTAGGHGLTRSASIVLWASFLWLLCAVAWAPLAGPHYSDIRLALINANIAVVVLDGIFLLFKSDAKAAAATASCWLVLGWLYLRAVSFSL
jgi:hypothetical protein